MREKGMPVTTRERRVIERALLAFVYSRRVGIEGSTGAHVLDLRRDVSVTVEIREKLEEIFLTAPANQRIHYLAERERYSFYSFY